MQSPILLAAYLLCVTSISVFGQDDLCTDIKNISAQYKKDKTRLMGKEKANDDMMTFYECPLPLSGAANVESAMYTASKKLAHSLGSYGRDMPEADAQKQFAALGEQFMKCFPNAKREAEDGEYEEFVAVDQNGSYIYLSRSVSKVNPDTGENFYSIHIQIMFYD